MSGIRLFDNYEEDGQLSLFDADYDDWDEDWTEEAASEDGGEAVEGKSGAETALAEGDSPMEGKETVVSAKGQRAGQTREKATVLSKGQESSAGMSQSPAGPEVRVKYCACCGKLLAVKEEPTAFRSECNNCGVKYVQKV